MENIRLDCPYYDGPYEVELWRNASHDVIPKEFTTISGNIVKVSTGKVHQGMGGIQLYAGDKPFWWGYYFIKKITDYKGNILWKNWDSKNYRLGNQPEEYELVIDYLGWLPENEKNWDIISGPLLMLSDIKDKEITIVNPKNYNEKVALIIRNGIIKEAFPMSFYGEKRAENWFSFCIVSKKDNPFEKFIIPLH